MVMFREDDERIRAENRERRRRNPLWRVFKVLVIIACLACASAVVLSAMGGKHEALKIGLEDYLRQATGKDASIGELVNMTFFPELEAELKNIALQQPTQAEEGKESLPGPVVATIDSVHIAVPFLAVLFSRSTFEVFELRGIKADAGIFTPKAVNISSLGMKEERLTGEGTYDGKKLYFAIEMEARNKGLDRVLYKLGKDRNVTLQIGGLKAEGRMKRGGGLSFEMGSLEINGKKADIKSEGKLSQSFGTTNFEGSMTYGRSVLTLDLSQKEQAYTGDISFDPLDMKDYAGMKELYDALDAVLSGGGGIAFAPSATAVVDFSVKSLEQNGAKLGDANTTLVLEKGILKAQPLGGTFSGGAIKGSLMLNGADKPAALELKLSVDDLDYGALQKSLHDLERVSGKANVEIALKGKGKGMDAILNDLNGDITVIAAEGRMESAAMLNLWGTGLLNVMLPNLSPKDETLLNCMIADFDVKGGVADAEVFFLDTERVTVVGEGTISIPNTSIDMMLKPDPKDAALIDVSTPIRVHGKLKSPDIAPDSVSLLEKLGVIALGTINPVFWAYSLTDLGLTESHPCRKYIGAKTP